MKEYAIMTLNLMTDHLILNGNASFVKRASAITAMIKELHPDLIGVQELTRTMFPYLQEVFADYGIFGDSRHSLIGSLTHQKLIELQKAVQQLLFLMKKSQIKCICLS
jgi:hypothetical protein